MHKSATMTKQGVKVVQVLFEYRCSKHQLTLPSLVCETVSQELAQTWGRQRFRQAFQCGILQKQPCGVPSTIVVK